MDECRQPIEQFLTHDLRTWKGLRAGCPLADVLGWLTPLSGLTQVRLGSLDVAYDVHSIEAPKFNDPIRAHTRDGTLAMLRTEFWSFASFDCAALLEVLGEAPERGPLVWRERTLVDAEWHYPDRGLSLGVAPDTGLIVTVSVYPPTTAAAYGESLAKVRTGAEFPPPQPH